MKTLNTLAALALIATLGCSSSSKQADNTPESSATQGTPTSMQQTAAGGQWVSYENALNTAKQSNKLIFVDIFTDWCTWCHKLDNDVYTDPRVKDAFAKSFVTTKINAESDTKHTVQGTQESEREMATAWNISAYPTLIFLDQTEKPVFTYEGYLPADQFVKLLTYVSSGDYQRNGGDFRGWLSTHSG